MLNRYMNGTMAAMHPTAATVMPDPTAMNAATNTVMPRSAGNELRAVIRSENSIAFIGPLPSA